MTALQTDMLLLTPSLRVPCACRKKARTNMKPSCSLRRGGRTSRALGTGRKVVVDTRRGACRELEKAQEEIEALHGDIDDIQKVSEELRNLAVQREEDLVRTKERMDVAVTELRGKVEVEVKQRSVTSLC